MGNLQRDLNAVVVLIICTVLISAFGVEFIWREVPCPLCMLQRLAMISAATGFLLNVWFGSKMSHYGLSLLSSVFGVFVALRQISLHVCPGMPTFGFPVLGLSLYTWSFIVFLCCVLSVAGLLFLYDPLKSNEKPEVDNLGKITLGLLLTITALNMVTTYYHCGLTPCHD